MLSLNGNPIQGYTKYTVICMYIVAHAVKVCEFQTNKKKKSETHSTIRFILSGGHTAAVVRMRLLKSR